MTKTEKTRNQKKSLLLPALAAACILALAVMIYVLIAAGKTGKETAAFTPPPFEAAAIKGTPEEKSDISDENSEDNEDRLKRLGYSSLDAVDYQVSVCGAPAMEEGRAILYLTNPETNQVWLKVRLLDASGHVLGESGLLRPGEYVRSVALDREAVKAARDAAGKSFEMESAAGIAAEAANASGEADIPVILRIMAYEPETYHSAGAVSLSTMLAAWP